jgi:hypothetical protein
VDCTHSSAATSGTVISPLAWKGNRARFTFVDPVAMPFPASGARSISATVP